MLSFCLFEGCLLFFIPFLNPIRQAWLVVFKLNWNQFLRRLLFHRLRQFRLLSCLMRFVKVFYYRENILMQFVKFLFV